MKTIYRWYKNGGSVELGDDHRKIIVNRIIITQLEKSKDIRYVYINYFIEVCVLKYYYTMCPKSNLFVGCYRR